MRCDKCEHWAPPKPREPMFWRELFGLCTRIHHTNHAESLVDEKYPDKWKERYDLWKKAVESIMKMEPAYVEDSSSYHAELFTKPDFFCACFKEKP